MSEPLNAGPARAILVLDMAVVRGYTAVKVALRSKAAPETMYARDETDFRVHFAYMEGRLRIPVSALVSPQDRFGPKTASLGLLWWDGAAPESAHVVWWTQSSWAYEIMSRPAFTGRQFARASRIIDVTAELSRRIAMHAAR